MGNIIELKIAIRNLIANSRRSLLTLFVIIISLSAILFIAGYTNMVRIGFREILIEEKFAHFRIYKKGFLEMDDAVSMKHAFSPEEAARVEEILSRTEGVKNIIPRITIQGMVGGLEKSKLFMGYGSVPGLENTMSYGTLLDGDRLSDEDPYKAVLGTGLAWKLDAELGDSLQISVPNEGGGIEAELITVGGIANFGPKDLNDTTLLVSLDVAQSVNFTDDVQMLLVMLDDTAYMDNVYSYFISEAEKAGLDVETRLWHELDPFYNQVMRDYTSQLNMVAIIFLCVVLLAVSNTIYMSIMERTPEIGTLRAIGISRMEILKTIFLEGLILGILGGVLGVAIAYGIENFFNIVEIELPPPPSLTDPIRLSIRLRLQDILLYAGLMGSCSSLISLIPGLKAANTNIVSAIRHA